MGCILVPVMARDRTYFPQMTVQLLRLLSGLDLQADSLWMRIIILKKSFCSKKNRKLSRFGLFIITALGAGFHIIIRYHKISQSVFF